MLSYGKLRLVVELSDAAPRAARMIFEPWNSVFSTDIRQKAFVAPCTDDPGSRPPLDTACGGAAFVHARRRGLSRPSRSRPGMGTGAATAREVRWRGAAARHDSETSGTRSTSRPLRTPAQKLMRPASVVPTFLRNTALSFPIPRAARRPTSNHEDVAAGKDRSAGTAFRRAAIVVIIVLCLIITYIAIRAADVVVRLLGQTGADVVGGIFGVLLAALAVQFIFDRLRSGFPHTFGLA
jgi:hypothetical protein